MKQKYCRDCSREFPWDEGDGDCAACGANELVKEAYFAGFAGASQFRTHTAMQKENKKLTRKLRKIELAIASGSIR